MNEKLIAHTPIFDLVEKQDDRGIGFNPAGINAPDWITIIVSKGDEFLMTNQLRYGLMHICEEFVAGQVDKGENPLDTAVRELKEETGIIIHDKNEIQYLGNFAANPAFMNNHMHYFYVDLDKVSYEIGDTHFDEHESIVSYWKNKTKVINNYIESHDSVFLAGALFLMNYNKINY